VRVAPVKTIIREGYSSLRQRFRLRALEWQNACISLGWGAIVLVNPSLFDAPAFRSFVGGPTVWGWGVLAVGLINIGALIINGTVPRPTAFARTLAACLQILLYLMLTAGFMFSGTLPPGIAVYGVLAIFGFFASAWALLDAVAPEYHGN
jgi:hypothetical protein